MAKVADSAVRRQKFMCEEQAITAARRRHADFLCNRFGTYAATPSRKVDELTSILIESASAVEDPDAPKDISPLESQRSWERQAEENLLARLEKGGFLAPPGPVDEVLNTVVNNLIVSAKLDVEAHCRVLLTTPFETFTIGHTIVISRGLIDVLPDGEPGADARERVGAHALGIPTKLRSAFNNQTMLSDFDLLQRFRFKRPAEEMQGASEKAIAMMRVSPYTNLANAGLFPLRHWPRAGCHAAFVAGEPGRSGGRCVGAGASGKFRGGGAGA